MNPLLHSLLAAERAAELRRAAAGRAVAAELARERRVRRLGGRERRRLLALLPVSRRRPAVPPLSSHVAVTIRYGFPDDALTLARLAALDAREPPAQPILVAEVDGEVQAALSLRDGAIVADPFRPTAALVELLIARAEQLLAGVVRPASRRRPSSRKGSHADDVGEELRPA
jgi:hypothetical protein